MCGDGFVQGSDLSERTCILLGEHLSQKRKQRSLDSEQLCGCGCLVELCDALCWSHLALAAP